MTPLQSASASAVSNSAVQRSFQNNHHRPSMWDDDNKSQTSDKEQVSRDDSEPLDGLGGARRRSSIDSEKLLID